ncbi:hypothetical protein PM082_015401 [Marasmius tenuissimus]|nr:hypothetical protein PM082_015401 [Marasmius tenuissimus]
MGPQASGSDRNHHHQHSRPSHFVSPYLWKPHTLRHDSMELGLLAAAASILQPDKLKRVMALFGSARTVITRCKNSFQLLFHFSDASLPSEYANAITLDLTHLYATHAFTRASVLLFNKEADQRNTPKQRVGFLARWNQKSIAWHEQRAESSLIAFSKCGVGYLRNISAHLPRPSFIQSLVYQDSTRYPDFVRKLTPLSAV